MAAITPHPHRGDLLAAGATVLAVAVATTNARMGARWDPAVLLVLAWLGCALLLGMAWLSPVEGTSPRAYQTVLVVAGLALLAVALYRLDQVLGTDRPLAHAGAVTWIAAALAGKAAAFAHRRNSAAATLLAAAAGGVALVAFVQWVFSPSSHETTRYILTLEIVAYVLGAVRLRDTHRRHAVMLADAAGLAALAIAASYALGRLGDLAGAGTHAPTGWALVILAVGFGSVAYAAVDREPGPAYIGLATLIAFVAVAGRPDGAASLVGWPLLLLLLGGGVTAAALRPLRPLPPAPDADADPAPTVVMANPSEEPTTRIAYPKDEP